MQKNQTKAQKVVEATKKIDKIDEALYRIKELRKKIEPIKETNKGCAITPKYFIGLKKYSGEIDLGYGYQRVEMPKALFIVSLDMLECQYNDQRKKLQRKLARLTK